MCARFAVVLATIVLPPALANQSNPTLETLLRRCEEYVLGYEPRLSTIVAREQCTQKVHVRGRPGDRYRRLVSDFLFLRLPGREGSWRRFGVTTRIK
jgi:hypothetical protein